jgi:hypothetical protein
MAALQSVTKQPSEEFTVALDFYGKLPPGNPTISSATASAATYPGGVDATATVISNTSCTVRGTQVRVGVRSGTSGVDYKVTITTTLSDGSILEDDFLLEVDAL